MRILILQHSPTEDAGIFADFAAQDRDVLDVVHVYKGANLPSLDDFDALWVLGGPQDV